MSKEKFATARQLIEEKNYEAARSVLRTIDHPTAKEWLTKLDNLAPAFPAQGAALPPRSFTTNAVIVLVLYFILWLPGLIANVIFLREAHEAEKTANQSLPGVGSLSILLGCLGLFPLLIAASICALALLGNNIGSTFSNIVRSL